MVSEDDKTPDYLPQELKLKSTGELIQIAPTASDEENDVGWDAIWVLHYRPTREVFDACKKLCESNNPEHRAIGVTILAQLGLPERTFLDETLEIFFDLLDRDENLDVLDAVAIGLGHIWEEPRKVKPLLKLKNHPDSEIRFAVTFGLQGEEDPLAIQALIELSSDEDEDVRDWATFGLANQIETDTAEIREALFNRVIDPKEEGNAMGEGLLGLARRRDERAFELIHKYLEAGNAGTLIFEAAEQLGDSRLYPTLVKLRDNHKYGDYELRCLEDAIAACHQAG